jgi:hypothetical protein
MAAQEPNAETVAVLLDGARGFLADESQRGESLNQRGAAVTGFLGVVIALAGTVEATTFGSRGTTHAVAAGLAGLALVALLVSVGLIGWGVLLPSGAVSVAIDDIEQFPKFPFLARTPVQTRGYLLQGVVVVLGIERARNNRKALWLRRGYLAMGTGLFLVSAAGITLTVEAITHA